MKSKLAFAGAVPINTTMPLSSAGVSSPGMYLNITGSERETITAKVIITGRRAIIAVSIAA